MTLMPTVSKVSQLVALPTASCTPNGHNTVAVHLTVLTSVSGPGRGKQNNAEHHHQCIHPCDSLGRGRGTITFCDTRDNGGFSGFGGISVIHGIYPFVYCGANEGLHLRQCIYPCIIHV